MMVRAFAPLVCLSLLLGCASDAKSIKLDDVDLSDMGIVQGIRAQLSVEDGATFANYVVKHSVSSQNFCGRPLIGASGKPPETVGQAIDLTLVRDAEERKALIDARKPKTSWELKQAKWDDLIFERDMLIDAQTMLRTKHGPAAEGLLEWKSIEVRKADIDRRLSRMKSDVFGSSE